MEISVRGHLWTLRTQQTDKRGPCLISKMLTPAEKIVVNLTVLSMALLLSFAIYTSMPSHARFVVARFWYYVTGTVEEVAHNVGLHTNHFKSLRDASALSSTNPNAHAEYMANAHEL